MTLPAQENVDRLREWAEQNTKDALAAFQHGDEEEAYYRLQDAIHNLERVRERNVAT